MMFKRNPPLKITLSVISVLALLWTVFFGKLLDGPPSGFTAVVMIIGWISFLVLFITFGIKAMIFLFKFITFRRN